MKVKSGKCIRRLSLRSLWKSRRRNLIAIAAIVLTALLFTALFTVAMSINSSYETYQFRQIGGYSHGTFKEVTEEQAKAIAGHKGVKETGMRKTIGFIDDGVFAKAPAEVSFMDENCTKWSYAQPDVGRSPKSGKEISMDTAALKLIGVEPEVGAEITLTYTVGDKTQLSYEKTDTFTLVGYWEYDDISPVHYINVSKEYAEAVETEGIAAGMEPFRNDLNVMFASSVDIQGQMEKVEQDLSYTWDTSDGENSVRIGVNWGYTNAQLNGNIDAAAVIAVIAFLALVIFTGYLIIYNIFQISVTGDIRFYGLLKTVGVTSGQLRRIIRWQALLLCMIGIPVGLLVGFGVGAALAPVAMEGTTFGAENTTISTSPLIFVASALFALFTVLLSCFRPGRIAARVSPVEAVRYTDIVAVRKKHRKARGAKVHQMAFANLGRNKSKTVLVVLSLALSVVLLNVLINFTGGFDMEKYLDQQTCADFIVSSTDYFNYNLNDEGYISEDEIRQIRENTSQTVSGCAYTLSGEDPVGWMSEEALRTELSQYDSEEEIESDLAAYDRKDDLLGADAQIEGLDNSLFDKLTVVEGDLAPLFQEGSNAIAVVVHTDDYGNVDDLDNYPSLGSTQRITYDNKDVNYTVCAYVTVPYAMSYRYKTIGYGFVLPADRLKSDSGQTMLPLFYLLDTPDSAEEQTAERYLTGLTSGNASGLMYESKASVRAEFESFQRMFLILGGVLCAIIGLVGILNYFNAIMTGILSRKREFAVLQAVGMTNRQLRKMLIYEGIFYALTAAVVALVLSVVLNPLICSLLENMFWFFSADFTIVPVLAFIPVFALLGWLIPSLMYRQSVKQSIVEKMKATE